MRERSASSANGTRQMSSDQRKRWKRAHYHKQNGICPLCEEHMEEADATLDHIIPVSKGGRNVISNFRAVHGSCNYRRGNKEDA